MFEPKPLRFVLLPVIIISITFGVLSFFKIQFQFYLWEIFIDLKILSLLLVLFFVKGTNQYQFSLENLHLKRWDLKKNLLWFLFPAFIYTAVAGSGIIFRLVQIEDFDNAATVILATAFDIPAIYVFSATTVFIEEIVFRALLFDSLRLEKSFWWAAILSALMWSLFSATEIINLKSGLIESLAIALNFLAVGLLCTVLVVKYKSVWISYSFRIGIISFTSLILPSILAEADPFFGTKLLWFFAEGLIVSFLLIGVAYFIGRSSEKGSEGPTAQILQN